MKVKKVQGFLAALTVLVMLLGAGQPAMAGQLQAITGPNVGLAGFGGVYVFGSTSGDVGACPASTACAPGDTYMTIARIFPVSHYGTFGPVITGCAQGTWDYGVTYLEARYSDTFGLHTYGGGVSRTITCDYTSWTDS